MTADGSLAGFERTDHDIEGVRIATWVGGDGPPVLLLHGYPQHHLMWRAVAPALAADHTVVVTDLRGYGESAKPAAGPDHAEYSKRAMAADQVGVMSALGFGRFAVVGHDRGGRVAHRMALDHPERVERIAVLDIAPTHHMVTTADRVLAQAYFHWWFLSQPADLPERMIGADPASWVRSQLSRGGHPMDDSVEGYVAAFADPAAISATCEDYRAAVTIDIDHDEADRHRLVTAPLLAVWGARGLIARRYDPLAVWRAYAADVRGEALPSGHFVAEEDPAGTVRALRGFLRG